MKMIEYFPCVGGLDMATAPLAIDPGRLLDAMNFEIGKNGRGYRLPEGHERFDGQPSPADATFTKIMFESGVAEISAGDTVTGSGSGATGVALEDAVVLSGSYGTSDASGYLIMYVNSGTFVDTDDLEVSAAVMSSVAASGVYSPGVGAPGSDSAETWRQASEALARTAITAVPGSGPVRGLFWYNSKLFAIRDEDAAPATVAKMYYSSAAGWVEQSLGETVAFTTGGTAVAAVGDTLTKGGVTATIRRIVVTSGSWTADTAAGFFLISGRTGGNFSSGAATAGTSSVNLSGAQTAGSLPPGGRYEWIKHNFGGGSGSDMMYGVNQVGKCIEFSTYGICPITTGMATDIPLHLIAHQNHLFLAFAGGSLQNSSLIDSPLTPPFIWSATLGAAELAVGGEIVGLAQMKGDAMVVFCKNQKKIIYGSSSADWNIQDHSGEAAGAEEWSIATVNEDPLCFDAGGITSVQASEAYGGFSASQLSRSIQKFLSSKTGKAVASVVSLAKTQYKVFFSDGFWASCTFAAEGIVGFMKGKIPTVPTCTWTTVEDGRSWFGDANGYVYELDKGRSHDGTAVTYFLRMPFNFIKTPRQWKRFFKMIFELDIESSTNLSFSFMPDFNYMNSNIPNTTYADAISFETGGMVWNIDEWNLHTWGVMDADDGGQPEEYIDGIATEMSLVIFLTSAAQTPFTLAGIMVEYLPLGDKR